MPHSDITWRDVPAETTRLIKASAVLAGKFAELIYRAPGDVWLNPDAETVWFRTRATEPMPPNEDSAWVRFKSADVQISDLMSPIGEAIGVRNGPMNSLWGGPRPLASLLAGGALGAGAGYGAGWLAEHALPDYFPKKRLRKALALLGGAAGAAPGAMQTIDNWSQGKGILDRWPTPVSELPKQADADLDSAMSDYTPFIDRDALHQVIWRDPDISPPLAAAVNGLAASAATMRGGARYISPFDVGRIAAGMGTGLLSGLVVGRTLGAITGLSPAAQNRLIQAGTLAGLLANVVPMALGQ